MTVFDGMQILMENWHTGETLTEIVSVEKPLVEMDISTD